MIHNVKLLCFLEKKEKRQNLRLIYAYYQTTGIEIQYRIDQT